MRLDRPSHHKYQQALQASISKTTATKAAEAVLSKLKAEILESLKKQLPKGAGAGGDASAKLKESEAKLKKENADLKRKAAAKEAGADGSDAIKKKKVATPQGDKPDAEAERLKLRRDLQAELLVKEGMKDGKKPCFFHFRDGYTCKNDAATCLYHHG